MKKTACLENGTFFFKRDGESLHIANLSSNDTNIQIIDAMPPNNTGRETLKKKTPTGLKSRKINSYKLHSQITQN